MTSRSRQLAISLVVACAMFMQNLDSTVIATALPTIADSLGESPLLGFADDPRPPAGIPRHAAAPTPVASPQYQPAYPPQPTYSSPYAQRPAAPAYGATELSQVRGRSWLIRASIKISRRSRSRRPCLAS